MKSNPNKGLDRPQRVVVVTSLCLAFLITLCFSSCSTKIKTGSLAGSVILVNDTGDPVNDPADFSGVTVAIYELAELDSTLARINTEYPQVGVPISQETEFDHRKNNPLKTTVSNPDGSYNINDVDPGVYIVALLLEHWGIRYVYRVEIEGGDTTNLGDTELYPTLAFSSSVTQNVMFKSDHSYHIQGDAVFISTVTIEPRAKIFIDQGCSVKFFGNVLTEESTTYDPWKFVSSKGMYSPNQTSINTEDYYSSIEFYFNPVNLDNGIFFHVGSTVATTCEFSALKNIMIRQCGGGLSISQGTAIIENITVAHGSSYGINVNSLSTEQTQVSHSIISNFSEGIVFHTLGTYSVDNSYFNNNTVGIAARTSTGSITHNAFDMNRTDIKTIAPLNPTDILYNNFYMSRVLTIHPQLNAYVHYNNFFRTGGNFIVIRNADMFNNSLVNGDLDATNNYWAVADVNAYILDGTDNPDYPDSPCPYFVIFIPKRASPVPEAGIQ